MPLQVAGSIPAGCMEGDVEHDGIQDDEVPISEALSVRFLQKQVRGSCEKHFGSTKLPERLRDLQNEVAEIVHYRDRANLEEEVGDAGWSLLQLCNEEGFDFRRCVQRTIKKLDGRAKGKKVALIGTSANPFTNAHLTMGLELRALTDVDEVWYLVVGEHPWADRNPAKKVMMPVEDRLEMVRLATAAYAPRLKVCDFEAVHAKEIYAKTRETCEMLRDFLLPAYPEYDFSWVMGSDVARSFHEWRGSDWLAANLRVFVIHRLGYDWDKDRSILADSRHRYFKDEIAVSNISSSLVRERGKTRDDAALVALVPEVVREYLVRKKLIGPQT